MRRTTTGRICNDCHRPLEVGETCNCRQPMRGTPRDGLRARCPYFQYRSSYRGQYYLACAGVKNRYPGCDERNAHYRRYCCGLYGLCTRYKAMKGEQDTCKAQK